MRNNKFKNQVLIVFIAIVFLSFSAKTNFFEVAKQIEIYTTLFKELSIYYIDEINPAELTSKAIKNTLEELDPYTNYFDEQEVQEERIKREGMYSGFGISVFYDQRGIVLNEIYEGYEADKKGLKAGDVIIKFENQSLKNMDRDELSEILKVAPNRPINLTVLRQGEIIYVTLVSEKIEINPVPFYDLIDQETGYIGLTRFNQKASSEVKKAFLKLKEKGMKNLIFDLRDNPGGSLGEAINISNFFLPKGSNITTTKAKVKKLSNSYKASKTPLDTEIPLTVLINERSASASEIVAGALQDYDRAVILGKRSFGKGLVQQYRKLTYGTQLKLTISKYYTPSGRCIQELDYSNRDSNGNVSKFSDGIVNSFRTKNGRIVYDGGGISPDILINFPEKTDATLALIKSKAIFNFSTDFYYNNPTISLAADYSFSPTDFKNFLNYLQTTDTIFKTTQENLFLKAFSSIKDTKLLDQKNKEIREVLLKEKISQITNDQAYLSQIIKNEILIKYYYKKGLFQNKLTKDKVILEAVKILKNKNKYAKILKEV